MGAGERFAGQLVDGSSHALRGAAGVDEDEGWGWAAGDLEQARMDGLPNAGLPGGRGIVRRIQRAECGHVFYRDLDTEVEALAGSGVDDGYGAEDCCLIGIRLLSG